MHRAAIIMSPQLSEPLEYSKLHTYLFVISDIYFVVSVQMKYVTCLNVIVEETNHLKQVNYHLFKRCVSIYLIYSEE